MMFLHSPPQDRIGFSVSQTHPFHAKTTCPSGWLCRCYHGPQLIHLCDSSAPWAGTQFWVPQSSRGRDTLRPPPRGLHAMSPGRRRNCRNWAVESGGIELSSDPGRASCRRVIKIGDPQGEFGFLVEPTGYRSIQFKMLSQSMLTKEEVGCLGQ